MKKILFICLLINSFSLIFISYHAHSYPHAYPHAYPHSDSRPQIDSLTDNDCKIKAKNPLMENGYRLCINSQWSQSCGTLLGKNAFFDPWGLRWTKKSSCCSIGARYIRKSVKNSLKNLLSPEYKECIFGN